MQIGRMRHRVELQEAVTHESPEGAVIEDGWNPVARFWAEVEDLEGGELFQAQQVQARRICRVKHRFRTDLKQTQRYKFGERLLYIDSITNPDGRKVEHVVICKEKS